MDDDGDDYVGQLKEVFDRCDTDNKGSLDQDRLRELCGQLQLEDQADLLVEQLLGDDKDGEVGSFLRVILAGTRKCLAFRDFILKIW